MITFADRSVVATSTALSGTDHNTLESVERAHVLEVLNRERGNKARQRDVRPQSPQSVPSVGEVRRRTAATSGVGSYD